MNIPEHFIRRPVMTTLVTAGITIFGWMAYRTLPVSDLPNVDYPILSISASLPGASPETMASAVATPIEQGLATVPGIESMTSTSTLGSTRITVTFNLERDLDAAAQDVQSALSGVQRRLPADMPTPPYFRKQNPADDPILVLALSSATPPPFRGQRIRGVDDCPTHLNHRRGFAGIHNGSPKVRRARSGRSPGSRVPRHRARRSSKCAQHK